MMDPICTGRMIARLRQEANCTQTQLAARVGVTREVVVRWEGGRGRLSRNTQMLLKLSALFGVSVEELLTGAINDDTDEAKGGYRP